MSETCKNCKFWKRWQKSINNITDGDCHKECPRIITDEREGVYSSAWPDTKPTDWCGEWEAQP